MPIDTRGYFSETHFLFPHTFVDIGQNICLLRIGSMISPRAGTDGLQRHSNCFEDRRGLRLWIGGISVTRSMQKRARG